MQVIDFKKYPPLEFTDTKTKFTFKEVKAFQE